VDKAACQRLREHLTGPLHNLPTASLQPLSRTNWNSAEGWSEGPIPEDEWLVVMHLTYHGAPYPPVQAHQYETIE
jgi:hypothetical protein